MLLLMRAVRSALQRKPVLGTDGLVGEVGRVTSWGTADGVISVHGEHWAAESTESLAPGDAVEVIGTTDRLRLRVRRAGPTAGN
jgi:membrane-bound serine protease (ClpP class)